MTDNDRAWPIGTPALSGRKISRSAGQPGRLGSRVGTAPDISVLDLNFKIIVGRLLKKSFFQVASNVPVKHLVAGAAPTGCKLRSLNQCIAYCDGMIGQWAHMRATSKNISALFQTAHCVHLPNPQAPREIDLLANIPAAAQTAFLAGPGNVAATIGRQIPMQPHATAFFNARLLVAEDNPVNQDIATRVLEHMGCRIVIAENGAVAERLLAREKFDLVLMDCEMPELDGFEVTRRFRQSEHMAAESEGRKTFTRIPIVALTAHVADDMRQKCLAAGMDDLLAKPFQKARISETLRRWIGNLERSASPEERSSISDKPDVSLAKQAAPDNSPIDRAILDDFLDSKGEAGVVLLRRLLLHFTKTAPATVASLREKYQAQQPEDLWRLAHGLRSSAAALGVKHLSRRLAEIERNAREHSLDGLEPMLTLLECDLAAALESLQNLIGEFDVRTQ